MAAEVATTSAQQWVRHGRGYKCVRPGHESATFEVGEVCPFCASETGEDPLDQLEDESPEDRSLRADVNAFRGRARMLFNEGKALIKEGTGRDKAAGAKLVAESIKYERLANDIAEKLASRAHDRKLMNHEKLMAGLRKAN